MILQVIKQFFETNIFITPINDINNKYNTSFKRPFERETYT